jgi:putative flippase GtrA
MNPNMRQMILYAVIGIAAAFIDFFTFYLLRRGLGLPLLLANTTGVCCGIAFSFFCNRGLNFKVLDRVSRRFVRFATVACAGLAASNALIYVLTLLNMRDAIAKVVSILIVGACQFLINYTWTFSFDRTPIEGSRFVIDEEKDDLSTGGRAATAQSRKKHPSGRRVRRTC